MSQCDDRDNTLTRRDTLRLAGAGILAASTSGWFGNLAAQAAQQSAATQQGGQPSQNPGGKAKACILLWMNGGPSQSHTFDLKEGGEYSTIATSVPGVRISEHLPKMAKQMQHAALIRSMATGEAAHPRARFLMHNGYRMVGGQSYPAIGCIAANELGKQGFELPNFVSIDGGADGNNAGGMFRAVPAYLGPKNAPLIVGDPAKGIENLKPAVSEADFAARMKLLESADIGFATRFSTPAAAAHQSAYQQAVKLMRSEKAKAFELERESQAVRDGYGDSRFGQGCLLARRLVEAGVPFVEVSLGGWDDHGGAGPKVKKRSPVLDQGMAALLADLKAKGLLDSTLVVWMGEFGRSPGGGSQHYAKAWTTLLAGGGIKGGAVVGKTDKGGKEVADRPVSAPDFMATICTAMGINFKKEFTTPAGRPIRIADKSAKPVVEILS